MSKLSIKALIESRTRDNEVRTLQAHYGMFGDVERRTFSHSVSEFRQAGTSETGANDGSLQIVGHAAVFEKPSVQMMSPLGVFTEFINARAFDNVLKRNSDVILDWDHDTRYILGRCGNGTLDLSVDNEGLRYWSKVADTTYARDLRVLMEGDYLNQSSFLFRIAPGGEDWELVEDDDGNDVVKRTIYEVSDLFDICVTGAGAYPQADSGIMRTWAFDYAVNEGFVNERKVIKFKETPKAEKDELWDGRTALKDATPEDLTEMCAWYDTEKKDADGNSTKDAFKFPHHLSNDEHVVVYSGVKTALARLNQANTQISDEDRSGVYTHLKKHYEEFGEDAPELRSRATIEAESRALTDELRALGEVAWGPDDGIEDLSCDLESELNEHSFFSSFSVYDVSVNLDKAIVCDWDDFSFWVVPFTVVDGDPVVSDMSEWVQVEAGWVTTTEGYEAKMRETQDRHARTLAAEADVPFPPSGDGAKQRLLAEARAKIYRTQNLKS